MASSTIVTLLNSISSKMVIMSLIGASPILDPVLSAAVLAHKNAMDVSGSVSSPEGSRS